MSNPVARTAGTKKVSRRRSLWKQIAYCKYLYMLIAPGFILTLIFHYFPMYGLQLAFKNFMYNKGIWGSPWNNFAHFKAFMSNPEFKRVVFNTLWISINQMIWNFPAPIILALLLNELRNKTFKRVTQSILYLPHFVNWIIISGLIFNLFSVTNGVVNKVLASLNMQPVVIIGNPNVFRPLLYISSMWKGVGWGTIIYMAAIAGVDVQLYESAIIDGANRFQQCIYITLPSLKYAIVILLILNTGGLMNSNFDQIFNLMGPTTRAVGEVIDTYVYRLGIVNARYDFSTAVGLFKQVINCILLFTSNYVAKLLGHEGFL